VQRTFSRFDASRCIRVEEVGNRPPIYNFDTLRFRNREGSSSPQCCTFSKAPAAQDESYRLGASAIDHSDEKFPNASWQAIRNARAPGNGLFFDVAYTLRVFPSRNLGFSWRNVRWGS